MDKYGQLTIIAFVISFHNICTTKIPAKHFEFSGFYLSRISWIFAMFLRGDIHIN